MNDMASRRVPRPRRLQRAAVVVEARFFAPANAVRTALKNSTIGMAAISSRTVALTSSVGADLKDLELRAVVMVNLEEWKFGGYAMVRCNIEMESRDNPEYMQVPARKSLEKGVLSVSFGTGGTLARLEIEGERLA